MSTETFESMKQLTETALRSMKCGVDGTEERALDGKTSPKWSGGTHEEVDSRQCEGLIRWCHVGGPEPLAAGAERVLDAPFLVYLNLCTCNRP